LRCNRYCWLLFVHQFSLCLISSDGYLIDLASTCASTILHLHKYPHPDKREVPWMSSSLQCILNFCSY
jgi:hypothetical protein